MTLLPAHMKDFMVVPVCHDIQINGETVGLHESGVLWWPDQSTVIVSDLHLEKGSSFAASGQMLPPYDTVATLEKLSSVMDAFNPARVISLGDSFHDAQGAARLPTAYRAMLAALQINREWIWITGNHDPLPPAGLGGATQDEVTIGGLTFRHEPQPGHHPGEVCGHLHPAAKVRRYGRVIRRACFVTDGTRLVLPAFGALTGGLNVMKPAFAPLFDQRRFSAFLLGDNRLYPFTASRLVDD